MPRPERIEYEGAYYHVMNRGRDGGRRHLFFSKDDYEAFLQTLVEAVERFDIVVHAYCLMSNHYHLLVQTPHANISRAMRHINGVYTQRFNRLKHTDGPLFRGVTRLPRLLKLRVCRNQDIHQNFYHQITDLFKK